ncbi:hypothetical protein ASF22_20005 [Methylobacterium sp. Leaf87]|nr:hypothetical protein ASF22_20005 [Methylobacterium sp. Leaf87]
MIPDLALRAVPAQDQGLEVFGWHPGEDEGRVGKEAEASVIGRITQHHAPTGATLPEVAQPGIDQALAYALTTMLEMDGHGSEPEPVSHSAFDLHGRKSDVSDDSVGLDRDEREAQRTVLPECVNDVRLRAARVRRVAKGVDTSSRISQSSDVVSGRMIMRDPYPIRSHRVSRSSTASPGACCRS